MCQELQVTLDKIKRKKVDFLLLHWPCDVIIAGLLKEVWFAIEKCIPDRLASTLDVCNFNITALRMLLPHCEKLRPLVNQQWNLINFCAQQDIVTHTYSTLGQGKLLQHNV